MKMKQAQNSRKRSGLRRLALIRNILSLLAVVLALSMILVLVLAKPFAAPPASEKPVPQTEAQQAPDPEGTVSGGVDLPENMDPEAAGPQGSQKGSGGDGRTPSGGHDSRPHNNPAPEDSDPEQTLGPTDPPVVPTPTNPPVVPKPTTPVVPEPTTPVVPEPTTPVVPKPTTPVVPEPTTPVVPEPTTPQKQITNEKSIVENHSDIHTAPPDQAAEAEDLALEIPSASGISVKDPQADAKGLWKIVFFTLTGLLALDLIAVIVISMKISDLQRQKNRRANPIREQPRDNAAIGRVIASVQNSPEIPNTQMGVSEPAPQPTAMGSISIGNLHHIGARPRQEDSSGVANLSDGVLAVVADGMGGLAGGDKISQTIVYTMLNMSNNLAPDQMDGVLPEMLRTANDTINNMLGQENLCKSGSTLLAVLVRGGTFHWLTVGDSHIYLYRAGTLIQLNQEHNKGQDLMIQACQNEISFQEARSAPKKGGLTSFLGMGQLRHVDRSLRRIPLLPGDRIMLSTDGVFNTLTDDAICSVLQQYPDVQQAADQIQALILRRNHPKQDNFTAVILGF